MGEMVNKMEGWTKGESGRMVEGMVEELKRRGRKLEQWKKVRRVNER